MLGSLLLLAVFILPSARPQSSLGCSLIKHDECTKIADSCWELTKLVELKRDIGKVLAAVAELAKIAELVKLANVTQANVTQLLIDLQILRGRQAVSGAVQVGQVLMFVAYLLTITVLYMVNHCNKNRERLAQSELELLEAKLQANKAKRRAAAARAKSAPGPSPK